MDTKLENALDEFYTEDQDDLKAKKEKIKFLNERDGLIVERLDTIYVDKSGRQLLREVY